MTCPKCGKQFIWWDGGDVVYSRRQKYPLYKFCLHEGSVSDFNPRNPTLDDLLKDMKQVFK